MLRLAVLVLLLANAAYFAWARDWLRPYGFAPFQQSEPQRLAQQIQPQALRIVPAQEAARRSAAAAPTSALAGSSVECVQAGPLDAIQAQAVRQAAEAALPPGTWRLEGVPEPPRWIIYMGKYPGVEAVARKRAELRQLGVPFEKLRSAALEPGLALGGFPSQQAATEQLGELAQRGVRTARVVQETPDPASQVLRLPAADEALRALLPDVQAALGSWTLAPCR